MKYLVLLLSSILTLSVHAQQQEEIDSIKNLLTKEQPKEETMKLYGQLAKNIFTSILTPLDNIMTPWPN